MKLLITLAIGLAALQASAMPQDYFFSMYGNNAKKYFDNMPKSTSSCAYIENKDGETEAIYLVIKGQKINSILCRQLGEQTYACEASTMLNSAACN